MAKDLNKVMLIGRVGKTPELRVLGTTGNSTTSFSVACNRNIKQGDSWVEQTEWVRVVAWERLAETAANYLKTGQRVYIEGRLQTRKYTDNKDNQEKTITEVVANDLILLEPKAAGGSGTAAEDDWGSPTPAPSAKPAQQRKPAPSSSFDDEMEPEDIPF